MILSALSYAKNGSPRAVRPLLLDRMFKSITPDDLKAIISFAIAIDTVGWSTPRVLIETIRIEVIQKQFT